jgi:lysophospholipase L1-like esterase
MNMNEQNEPSRNMEKSSPKMSWAVAGRILLKAAAIFLLANLLFAIFLPVESLGKISLYNNLLPGRLRLPYGENAADSYNLSLNNIPAMLASHAISQPKAADEFRVVIIGDSGTWGWLLENEDTLAGQITGAKLRAADGRQVVAYNLGYPIMALTKDLMILEEARQYEPDLILWPVTLQSFPWDKQLVPPLVRENPDRFRSLIDNYGLNLDPQDDRLDDLSILERSIFGQRRALADLLRLQSYGFSWAATGIDQVQPAEITLPASDFEEDVSWDDFESPVTLTSDILAIDALEVGAKIAGKVPIIFINEPIFISDGENSELRYNAWYPRWAYDEYRQLLGSWAGDHDWYYLDMWDFVPPGEFTDSPVHLTQAGINILANALSDEILRLAGRSN